MRVIGEKREREREGAEGNIEGVKGIFCKEFGLIDCSGQAKQTVLRGELSVWQFMKLNRVRIWSYLSFHLYSQYLRYPKHEQSDPAMPI